MKTASFFLALALSLILSLATSSAPAASLCADLFGKKAEPKIQDQAMSPLTSAELSEHVFAVHATNHFPEGGVIRSDLNPHLTVRPELHFALGALVQSHALGSWENSRYAVVTPLKNLEPQLINLFIHDTTVLGDLSLKPGTVIVMPVGENPKLPPGVTAHHYRPGGYDSLRTAISTAIKERGGYEFDVEMANGTMNDYVSSESAAKLSGLNLNIGDFLSPLLKNHPGVTSTVHSSTNLGAIDLWLGTGLDLVREGHAYEIATPQLAFERDVIRLSLQRIKGELPWTTLTPESKQKLQASLLRLRGYLNIVDADLNMRVSSGKTAFKSPDKFQAELFKLANDPKALAEYLKSQASQLDDVGVVAPSARGMRPATLARFTPAEVTALYRRHAANFPKYTEADFLKAYASVRLRVFPMQLSRGEIQSLGALAIPDFANLDATQRKKAFDSFFAYSPAASKVAEVSTAD